MLVYPGHLIRALIVSVKTLDGARQEITVCDSSGTTRTQRPHPDYVSKPWRSPEAVDIDAVARELAATGLAMTEHAATCAGCHKMLHQAGWEIAAGINQFCETGLQLNQAQRHARGPLAAARIDFH
jgi:hypothetical protein